MTTPRSEPAAAPPADPAAVAADPAQAGEIRRRMAEIDLGDSGSVIGFGASAQTRLQQISQAMLADVRNKDLGPAGASLRAMVTAIRGFNERELDQPQRGLLGRLLNRMRPAADLIARYEQVRDQIERITRDLLGHEHQLLKDIKALDQLYAHTLDFHDELALYIAAGEARLAALDGDEIPALARAAETGPEEGQVLRAQALRDLRAARDDLDRRVHDLKLTRQVTMQALPSIRLVQENDKALVSRINSTLVNTVPLWETQLAQALTIRRSGAAAEALRGASDLTNDLLTANARNLRSANRAVRTEMERGVFDIEAVKAANAELIATIDESLAIADAGRARRAAAETDLRQLEADLRQSLSAARARADAPARSG